MGTGNDFCWLPRGWQIFGAYSPARSVFASDVVARLWSAGADTRSAPVNIESVHRVSLTYNLYFSMIVQSIPASGCPGLLVPVPSVTPLSAILPEEPLLMMGAGPVPIPDAVARANGVVINHLGSSMATVIGQVKSMARYVFQTESKWVLGVAGPGSAAMEMAVTNLVFPGTRVLCANNGYFGARMADMAHRLGADLHTIHAPDRQAIDAQLVCDAIERLRPEILTIVHGETSSTVCNSALKEIAFAARANGCLVVVDAVCTLSTMPFSMDEWGLDAVITGGQKGLSSIPGVSLLAFSEAAWSRIRERPMSPPHWCLDAMLAERFWHDGSYHYTAPVSGVLALHEALRLVCLETLERRFSRHRRSSEALQQGIESLGLNLYIERHSRLNSVIGVTLPVQLNAKNVCGHISERYQVEVSGSFGAPIVRIGQMGEQCRDHHLFRTLHALGRTMLDLGCRVDLPKGMAALEEALSQQVGACAARP